MQKLRLLLLGTLLGAALTLLFFSARLPSAAAAPDGADDQRRLPAAGPQAPQVLPTAAPGETLVYFTWADSTSTATVLNLINTDSVAHSVTLRGYSYSGVLLASTNFNLAAASFQRLVSDDVALSAPASWKTPIPYVTSFGDSVAYASLSLQKGVKVDGYTLFNAATGTVDPTISQGAIPLRFSADAYSIFVPDISR